MQGLYAFGSTSCLAFFSQSKHEPLLQITHSACEGRCQGHYFANIGDAVVIVAVGNWRICKVKCQCLDKVGGGHRLRAWINAGNVQSTLHMQSQLGACRNNLRRTIFA